MLMARPFVYKDPAFDANGPPLRLQSGKTGETGMQDDPQRPPNLEHLMLMARPFVYKVRKPGKPGHRTIPKDPQTWSI